MKPGIKSGMALSLKKAQTILETVLALSMLILFLMGAMAILKSTNQ